MNYVQDFGKGTLIGLLAFDFVSLVLYKLNSEDKEFEIELSPRVQGILLAICIWGVTIILHRQQGLMRNTFESFIMLLYLLLCSVTDYYTQQVYDFMQLGVCILIGVSTLFGQALPARGAELIVFAGLQILIFRRMYGEADVMCFLICALSMVERGILVWTCHMGVSFLLLGIVQGVKHNIAADGNLKVPVAFFPYMAVAYMLFF